MLDEPLPETAHDFRVDLIVTGDELIVSNGPRRRPEGIVWDDLDPRMIEAIPWLVARAAGR